MQRCVWQRARTLLGLSVAAHSQPLFCAVVLQPPRHFSGSAVCNAQSPFSSTPPACTRDHRVALQGTMTHATKTVPVAGVHQRTDRDALVGHCDLLRHVANSQESSQKKKRRVAGIVRLLEQNYADWLMDPLECTPAQASQRRMALVESLALCVPWLERRGRRQSADGLATKEDDLTWSGTSPFFSPEVHDGLCLCLQAGVEASAESPARTIAILQAAVQLELADGGSLQMLSRRLSSKQWCQTASPHELAQSLKWISLAMKRCKSQLPPLDHMLCRLPSAELSRRDALEVLSSLVRLRDVRATDVVKTVERNATKDVVHYTITDIVYALQAVAILDVCDTTFAAAVLKRCEQLVPQMDASRVGDVCKYVALLHPGRQLNDVASTCPREMRRLLPALVERSEALLGQFGLRDARCVLRCFQQHNVRHSVVFSQLTPLAA